MAINLNTHYIVLVQTNESSNSRRFLDYESHFACMDGITKMFDLYLKKLYPQEADMSYDMCSLVKFIHSLKDLSCLVYSKKYNMYKPQGKEWIIQELYKHLKQNSADQS